MADEALSCFTSLLENVPGWIAELDSISNAVRAPQREMMMGCPPATQSEGLLRKLSKSSSRKSDRSKDDEQDRKSGRFRPTLQHLANSDALRISQRKRKPVSVASGDQSGPCKFRNKGSAPVYYDGETQLRFEKLVRAVGASRNSIRKGKMGARVDALSRSGSSSSDSSGGEDDDDSRRITSGLRYKTARSRLPAFGKNDGSEAFDGVDSRLEKAQSLCERAAHQVLRDGTCTQEVTNAKEHFSEALRLAVAELPLLQKRAAKALERRRRSADQDRLDEEAQATTTGPHNPNDKADTPVRGHTADITIPSDGDLEVDVLEADDSQSSSDTEEFNIASFQFAKRGERFAPLIRPSRLVAH